MADAVESFGQRVQQEADWITGEIEVPAASVDSTPSKHEMTEATQGSQSMQKGAHTVNLTSRLSADSIVNFWT